MGVINKYGDVCRCGVNSNYICMYESISLFSSNCSKSLCKHLINLVYIRLKELWYKVSLIALARDYFNGQSSNMNTRFFVTKQPEKQDVGTINKTRASNIHRSVRLIWGMRVIFLQFDQVVYSVKLWRRPSLCTHYNRHVARMYTWELYASINSRL